MSETAIHYRTCPLCEAMCGLAITHADDRIVSIKGDKADPLSAGHLCPKAVALKDIHDDLDRLRRPLKRTASGWREIGWEEALTEVTGNLRRIRREHGNAALAAYFGNPTAHTPALLMVPALLEALQGAQIFSATSVDQLPTMLASLEMFGHQLLFPVPDLDRTDFLLIVGGNPAASNGSLMSGGNIMQRIAGIRARGGRVVVIDPRRTETAEVADAHLFIRPGTDSFLLAAIAQVIFAEGAVRLGELAPRVEGVDALAQAVAEFTPERVAATTGIGAETIRALALELAKAKRAAIYGRIGTCTQEFGALANWLLFALNVLTGNLDRIGGMLLPTPPIDLPGLGPSGSFARRRTRVRGLPAFGDEFPVAALAEEILTPGRGQIRALLTHAGNPVLSTPNGGRLDAALGQLEFMVAIDFYLNETTRRAHIILPPAGPLERVQMDPGLSLVMLRNVAKWSPPLFAPPPDSRQDWQILLELALALERRPGKRLPLRLIRWLGFDALIDLLLRLGPYGTHAALLDPASTPAKKLLALFKPRREGLSLAKLRRHPHGIDLGALAPGRLAGFLARRQRTIQLAPPLFLADLPRARTRLGKENTDGLRLIGRRHVRDNNSWMHNSHRLVKGRNRCTLLIHPVDAARLGVAEGQMVRVASRVGAIELPAELSEAMMPGVVSIPHGYGHRRAGTLLRVAQSEAPGASVNDLTDEKMLDAITGVPVFNGLPVSIAPSGTR